MGSMCFSISCNGTVTDDEWTKAMKVDIKRRFEITLRSQTDRTWWLIGNWGGWKAETDSRGSLVLCTLSVRNCLLLERGIKLNSSWLLFGDPSVKMSIWGLGISNTVPKKSSLLWWLSHCLFFFFFRISIVPDSCYSSTIISIYQVGSRKQKGPDFSIFFLFLFFSSSASSHSFSFSFFSSMLENKHRTSCMLGKPSSTELLPQLLSVL